MLFFVVAFAFLIWPLSVEFSATLFVINIVHVVVIVAIALYVVLVLNFIFFVSNVLSSTTTAKKKPLENHFHYLNHQPQFSSVGVPSLSPSEGQRYIEYKDLVYIKVCVCVCVCMCVLVLSIQMNKCVSSKFNILSCKFTVNTLLFISLSLLLFLTLTLFFSHTLLWMKRV